MKKFAKFALIVALVAMMLCLFASCGGKFKCDICEKEKSGKKHTETIFGEKVTMCDDCYKEYKAGMDALSGLSGLGDLGGDSDFDLSDLGL